MTGLIKININQPNKKEVEAIIENILKLEKPKTFIVNKSLLSLISKIHLIDTIKIINGSN